MQKQTKLRINLDMFKEDLKNNFKKTLLQNILIFNVIFSKNKNAPIKQYKEIY